MKYFTEYQKIKEKIYSNCRLCPRKCGVNRQNGSCGVCGMNHKIFLARAALHFWEEPCISGKNGSGAVFFSGCPLHCVYCQNRAISDGSLGKEVSPERLSDIYLELQEKGANNINLVTAGHYIPDIVYSVERARNQGMRLPVVYNTGSYETADSLKLLEGIVDVYLPDDKYMDEKLGQDYSKAADYPVVAEEAIAEMVRQQPTPFFYKEGEKDSFSNHLTWITDAEDGYLIAKGVIVRHLMLPGHLEDSKKVVSNLFCRYGNQIFYSLMNQYTPVEGLLKFPDLQRKVSQKEYEALVDYAIDLGVVNGFIQEGDTAKESFIPEFNCEEVEE